MLNRGQQSIFAVELIFNNILMHDYTKYNNLSDISSVTSPPMVAISKILNNWMLVKGILDTFGRLLI